MDAISTLPVNVQELPTLDTVLSQEESNSLPTFALTMDEVMLDLTSSPVMLQDLESSSTLPIELVDANTALEMPAVEDDVVILEASEEAPIIINETEDEKPEAEIEAEQAVTLAWFTMPTFEPPAKPIEIVLASEQPAAIFVATDFLSAKQNPADKTTPPLLDNQAEPTPNTSTLPIRNLPINDKDTHNTSIISTLIPNAMTATTDANVLSQDMPSIDNMMITQMPTEATLKQFSIPSPGTNIASELEHISIPVSVDDSEWPNQFNQQIMWMGKQNIDTALVKIHPQELGPVEISIKMVKDDASITITAHHLPVRELIEQAMPRLKDMMAEQGINLANVNVESNRKDTNGQAAAENDAGASQTAQETEADSMIKTITRRKSEGVVDYFA